VLFRLFQNVSGWEAIIMQKMLLLDEKLNPAHTAVLVVDVQNDFCHPQGFFGEAGIAGFSDQSMLPMMKEKLISLLAESRLSGALLVFIRGIYDPIYISPPFAEKLQEIGILGKMCLEGTWGANYWDEIKPSREGREIEVVKHRYSAFAGTSLDLILRSNGIRTLILTGVATSGCVDSTARDGFFLDYYIILASDCMGDWDTDKHKSSIAKLESTFGHTVASSDIIKIWRRRG
jgi:ureidoacrylate peracid hydrolase